MSHNYPYRRPPSDSDRRPDPGLYGSADRRQVSSDNDFYRPPQDSFASSHPSSSSSSSSRGAQWTQDGALGILNSCGLEPGDLALLAELPEDVLTIESLPQVLKQIKGKRATIRPFPPNAPSPPSSSSSSSYLPSSSRRLALSPSTGDWDPHSQPLQYPLDHVTPDPLSSELDRWGNPRTCGSVRTDPPLSSSSSSYVVDFHHRPGPSEYGKTGRDTGPVSSRDYNHRPASSDFGKTARDSTPVSPQDYNYRPGTLEYSKTSRDSTPVSLLDYNHRQGPSDYGNTSRDSGPVSSQDYDLRPGLSDYGKTGRDTGPERPSFSSAGRNKRTRPSRFSQPEPADHRSAPPPEELHPKTQVGHQSETSSTWSNSSWSTALMPSKKKAMDFHGTSPATFPYSCSLCDITVMSEKVWIKHINGPHHADGQLTLLQQFPNWDCRMETVIRVEDQSEKRKDEGQPARQTANQSSNKPQPNLKVEKKTADKSKVVCVKFPAQSVDEAYLRKLTEPFGKVVKILMFPSLAFVELGSIDQAKDLVKFHTNYPPTVNGEQMEFRISKTFNFLQSSRVVSFTPAPIGEDSQSDLISIIKRFGSPLYTLFLPSKAFVEMKNTPDAQKLVDYYSSKNLRINNEVIQVSFSGEYKSLMRVTSAKKFEEETSSTKRSRSLSREKEDKTTETKRRRSSKDREEEGEKSSRDKRTRSRSRENDEKRTRTKSRSRERSGRDKRTRTRSKSREKSTKEKSSRTRSRSKEKSKEHSRERRSRSKSRSRDKSSKEEMTTRSKSREKSIKEENTRSRSRSRDKSSNESRVKLEAPVKTETPDSESRTDPDPAPVKDIKPKAEVKEEPGEEAESSADESDIEGMEVIGEDGESLEDEDLETLDDTDAEEEEEKEEDKVEGSDCLAENTDSREEDNEVKVKNEEAGDQEIEIKQEKMEKEKPINEKRGEEVSMKTEREKPINEREGQEESMKKEEKESESSSGAEETQPEEDKEERDFPVDLENCITLDELGEDQSDDQDEKVSDEPKSSSYRVVYFDHLPQTHFSDLDFFKLVKDFGTPVRYFRVPGRQKGFIEMSTSAEALRAVNELSSKSLTINGSKIYINISNRYMKLSNGRSVQMAMDKEKRRSERYNRDESEERRSEGRRESSRKTPEKKSTSKKTPEKDSKSRKTPEESVSKVANKKSSEKESASRSSPEKKPERESAVKNGSEKISRTTPEKESANKKTSEKESKKTEEKKDSAEEESAAKKAPEKESLSRTRSGNKTLKRKGTHENESVPEKTEKKTDPTSDETAIRQELEEEEKLEIHDKEGSAEKTPETEECKDKKTPETEECKDKKTPETDECKDEKSLEVEEETSEPGPKDSESLHQPDSTSDPPKPQTEQKAADDQLQDSEAPLQVQQQPEPAGGAAELQTPTKPVGTEFVRPVVGYFCNLCQLIYADEDEAKLQHCSTLTHYRKYQEKTGKDPWAS
ncbi:matrin 3-like 1.1 isoform X2 [Epinephelus fuscoguttatus]|uniref:matrin 3-like 1.1 isoform X2 n=1 Tax=Epinephelus fuscoguttatus TaxID=293821 RepID=UPI0020D0FD95|nr:matrin 3-like 1.1 isoform X2 [Epinephelus fuscoguttatus]